MRTRYVIVLGQVFRWEEKAPFVRSGKSVHAAIEYDRESSKVRCHECGEWFSALGAHVKYKHSLTAREFKQAHGLRLGSSLQCPRLREQSSAKVKQMIAAGVWDKKYIEDRLAQARSARVTFPKKMQTSEGRNQRGACDAQIVMRIQRLATELGRVPARSDADRMDKGLVSACMTYCDSWMDAVKKAGLAPTAAGNPRPDLLLLEALRDFYVLNQRFPKSREFGRGRLGHRATYILHFKSLEIAYAKAGLGMKYAQSLSVAKHKDVA